ncbi:MAG: hypothetical protein ABW321_10200 [Polyangiales bacterium]
MSAFVRHLLRACCVLSVALSVDCSACQGHVEHPRAGDPNTPEYCGKASPEENNCMACTAKPGCGFCPDAPAGAPTCQPGISGGNTPTTCPTPLLIASTQCAAPPPPADNEP